MSISFAGLSIVSLQNPFTELAGLVVGKGDLKTMLCLLVFCIVSLVLAYLTNPSENSFRAYLTEQSFRQHLSRLDESCDDSAAKLRANPPRTAASKGATAANGHILPFDGSSPFHFANRAAISLRTPKHVFHSFGVFTVAAMIPLPKSSIRDDRDGLMISDSWYIGAFGKWWRGGILETWYQDVISRSKDEESWSSGILSMKSLDMLQDFAGPASKIGMTNNFMNGSLPKLRNRDRAVYKNNIVPPRSTTPPPLPKSASLPLHTTRAMPVSSERAVVLSPHTTLAQPLQPSNVTETNAVGASLPSRSPSTLFDQSPRIAHVLEQISASKTSLIDLRAQLHDYQTSASQTHAALQEEVNSHREHKRVEDAAKLETKSRTKALDDSKRSAEGLKRESDKKLKAAQSVRDQATYRMQTLDKEMAELQQRACDDEENLRRNFDETLLAEQHLMEELELKKQEIKAAEDIIAALNHRARDLEDQLTTARESLSDKKNLVKSRRAQRMQALKHGTDLDQGFVLQVPSAQNGFKESDNGSSDPAGQITPESATNFSSYRPPHLLLGSLPTFNSLSPTNGNLTNISPTHSQYHVLANPQQVPYNLPSFGDEVSRAALGLVSSPTSQSLIPSGLITSLDNSDGLSISRSFQSDNDPYLEKEWRDKNLLHQAQTREGYDTPIAYDLFTASRISAQDQLAQSSKLGSLENPSYTGAYDGGHANGMAEATRDFQLSQWTPPSQTDVDVFQTDAESPDHVSRSQKAGGRWLPTISRGKSKRGLNPDAKEFSLPKGSPGPLPPTHHSLPSFDNLNPNGLGSSILTPAASTSESLLRAFAPSPAEREALQRALGGPNTSFERLPSLSDVGSIPSSPSHVHALPIAHSTHVNKRLPSWLPAFPRGRKSMFSPWDDDEPSTMGLTNTGRKS